MAKEEKEMRKGKNLIILVLILIVLIVSYAFVSKMNKEKESNEGDSDANIISVSSIDKTGIDKVNYVNSLGEVTLVKKDDLWKYQVDENANLNQVIISSMLDYVSDIKADKIVEENSSNLSEYGLDNPGITINVSSNNATTKVYIGNETPTGNAYYLMINDVKTVYLVDADIFTNYNRGLAELISLDSLPEIDTQFATLLSIDNKNGVDIDFTYKSSGEEKEIIGSTDWYISKAYNYTVAGELTGIQTLLKSIAGIRFTKCVEYNCLDLSKYGLDAPDSNVTFGYYVPEEELEEGNTIPKFNYGSFKLYIGDKDEESGSYYARLEGFNSVNLLDAEIAEKILNIWPFEYVSKTLDLVNVDTVDSINIDVDSISNTMSIERETQPNEDGTETVTNVFYFNNKEVEQNKFKELYEKLISIEAAGEIDPAKESQAEPYLQIVFHRNVGIDTFIVQVIPYDVNYYKVNLNGEELFLADKRAVGEIVDAVKNFK